VGKTYIQGHGGIVSLAFLMPEKTRPKKLSDEQMVMNRRLHCYAFSYIGSTASDGWMIVNGEYEKI
jgi:hypothetical protein